MNTELLKCGIEYKNELHSLILQFYEITDEDAKSEKLKSTLAEFLTHPKYGAAFLIRKGNENIGYAILCFGYSFEYGGRDAFIDEFFILPEYRKQGIGKNALEYLIKYSRTIGIKAIHLEVKEKHKEAEGLYERTGFVFHNGKFMSLKLD